MKFLTKLMIRIKMIHPLRVSPSDFDELALMEKGQMESSRSEEQAYAQGRSEIISTILHNIGNAINSVTIGIGTIQENIVSNKLTRHFLSLANAVKEHQQDFSDYVKNDPQGQKVAPFIIALSEDFAKHNEELARTVLRVSERAQYIADIIQMEKMLDRKNVYLKNVDPRKAILNTVALLQDSLEKRGIEVLIDCDSDLEEISTKESHLYQVLINLVKNSIQSIDTLRASDGSDIEPFIRVKCYVESDFLILEVTDNGAGTRKDDLEAASKPGRAESSFGLHSIADSVCEFGGHIQTSICDNGECTMTRVLMPLSPFRFL